jgi:hypothetical protein
MLTELRRTQNLTKVSVLVRNFSMERAQREYDISHIQKYSRVCWDFNTSHPPWSSDIVTDKCQHGLKTTSNQIFSNTNHK